MGLLLKELREVFYARAFWITLLILSVLTGFSLEQAISLFSAASGTAMQFRDLAQAMTPLDGIFVPTFGALYLVTTLLFPFIAVRLIANEKQTGAIQFLTQLPVGLPLTVLAKVLAVMIAWGILLLVPLLAVALWRSLGGHVYLPELLNLVLGYVLYALATADIAFFAAAVTDSAATAAIVTLALTIGAWVLDFLNNPANRWLSKFSFVSLTVALRNFERGLLDSRAFLFPLLVALALLLLTVIWLVPWQTPPRKTGFSLLALLGLAALLAVSQLFPIYRDFSEDQRNSFAPAEERLLHTLTKPLVVTVYMTPDDARFTDLDRKVLAKLRRAMPHVAERQGKVSLSGGMFGGSGDENYGQVSYQYGGRTAWSRATTPREVLPLIFALAGVKPPTSNGEVNYPGYPLVASGERIGWWFYLVVPILVMGGWWFSRRPVSIKRFHLED